MILIDRIVTLRSRSPCGERGLKSTICARRKARKRSLPVRGAWIEIAASFVPRAGESGSLPVRGAWIEIEELTEETLLNCVAPRAGSVD